MRSKIRGGCSRVLRFAALLLPIWVSVLCVDAPKAQTYEQKLEMVKEFKRFFRKYTEPAQQVEAVLSLETADSPEAVEVLIPVLRHRVPEVAAAAKKVISGFSEPATFAKILEEIPDLKDKELRASFIEILGRAKQAQLRVVMKDLVEKFGKRLSFPERYQIARAYGRVGLGDGAEILFSLANDKSWEVRVAALDSFRLNKFKPIGKRLVPFLKDKVWQVRAAAIQCLAQLRTFEAVDPLIEMLKSENRLKVDVSEALFRITTYDFAVDYEMWRRQWDTLSKLKGFRLPTDEELEKAEQGRKKYAELYGKGGKKKSFAKIPTHSTRIVFIIDASASMADMVVDRKKFAGYKSFRKLDIVKEELINTINGLDAKTSFNILAFATKVKPWKKWLTPGNILNKTSAISFVKRLEPRGVATSGFGGGADGTGKTNTHAALLRAFDYDPSKGVVITGKNNSKALKLDTIYFLTDGRPSIGKFVDTEDILREVRKANEVRKVVIHCISIGEFEAAFLKRLAAENGGVFVNLGG